MKVKAVSSASADPGVMEPNAQPEPTQDEQNQLPPEDSQNAPPENQPEPAAEASNQEELLNEIKSLRAKVESFENRPFPQAAPQPAAVDPKEQQEQATKAQVLADINAMDEDDFVAKYKMSRIQANNALIQHDFQKEKQRNSERIAELEAKNELIAKYPEFSRYFDRIRNVVSDLSPESRQQTEKLKQVMEREFIYITSLDKPKASADGQRRQIVNDFHKPTPKPINGTQNKPLSDEIDPEYREICGHFGITKESERKKWMSPYIPTKLGVTSDGYEVVIDDPKGALKKVKVQ